MSRAILINGPSKSGIDTLAYEMLERFTENEDYTSFTFFHTKFADPLKQALLTLFGLDFEKDFYLVEDHQFKDTIRPEFFNHKPRDLLIKLSENYAKTYIGSDFFGKVFVRKLSEVGTSRTVAIVSDCGFDKEALTVVNGLGADNVLVIELQRHSCSFDGDSRSYLDLEQLTNMGVRCTTVYNQEGDVNHMFNTTEDVIEEWLAS